MTYSTTLPEFLWTNVVAYFLDVKKTCVDNIFVILPSSLKNLLESENLVCSAMANTKIVVGIFQI